MLSLEIFDGHLSTGLMLILPDFVVVRRYAVCSATKRDGLDVFAQRERLN